MFLGSESAERWSPPSGVGGIARPQDRAVRPERPAEEPPLLPHVVRSAHAPPTPRYCLRGGHLTLEALQAEQGDCRLIHYGPAEAPRFVVVDGGPGEAIYSGHLLPRLQQLRARWAPERPLPLPLVVCSHIDNDHIGGIIELVEGVTPAASDAVSWSASGTTASAGSPPRPTRRS